MPDLLSSSCMGLAPSPIRIVLNGGLPALGRNYRAESLICERRSNKERRKCFIEHQASAAVVVYMAVPSTAPGGRGARCEMCSSGCSRTSLLFNDTSRGDSRESCIGPPTGERVV